jgi:hypothetical protein
MYIIKNFILILILILLILYRERQGTLITEMA